MNQLSTVSSFQRSCAGGSVQPHVLLLDRDRDLLSGMEELLKLYRFRVSTADDGQLGLQLASVQKPDAVLMDLLLPSMNGFDVCEAIRASAGAPTFLVAMTARMDQTVLAKAAKAGFHRFLLKPYPPEQLIAVLDEGCSRKRLIQCSGSTPRGFHSKKGSLMYELPIHEGDLVRLRAGGPVMSATEVNAHHKTAVCFWFDSLGRLREENFFWTRIELVNHDQRS